MLDGVHCMIRRAGIEMFNLPAQGSPIDTVIRKANRQANANSLRWFITVLREYLSTLGRVQAGLLLPFAR